MNFEYSSGLFGYGIKGADGSEGLSGMSLYFTDYDPYSDFVIIANAINNNETLISSVPSGTKLPGGRSYINGDLFVDARGQIWEINNTTKRYSITPGKLLAGDYFITDGAITTNGFYRYWNSDASVKYIIDSVHSKTAKPNYTSLPNEIYGVLPKNFVRIEYCDVINSLRNAFTVYSAGETEFEDDHKSFAIVRELSGNTFRIGNINESNSVRQSNICFDVSSLKKNSILIGVNTPTGEILSNSEIKSNSLFTNIFNPAPNSFIATSDATDASIRWVLSDFTTDPCICADLYLYEKYLIDIESNRIKVFHNLDYSGYVNLSNVVLDTVYGYYMSINKDGWIRKSLVKEVRIGEGIKTLTITAPASKHLDVSANGSIAGNSTYNLQFTTNSSDWSTSADSWIKRIPISGNWLSTATDISVDVNTGGVRYGNINITSGPVIETVTVTQESGLPYLMSSPSHIRFDQFGGLYPTYSNMIRVKTSADVTWDASTPNSWINIVYNYVSLPITGSGSFSILVNPGDNSLGMVYVYSADISTHVYVIRQTI
jgi:hypothetical protein